MTSIALGDEKAAEAALDKLLGEFGGRADIVRAMEEVGDRYAEFGQGRKAADAVHEVVEEYRDAGENERARGLYARLLEQWPYSGPAMMELQVGLVVIGM